MKKKIKIQTTEQKRLSQLEIENADLWYESLLTKMHLETANQEIADLWYQIILGGDV